MSRKKVVYLNFDAVFNRVTSNTNIKNIVQLADFLDISQSAVSQKKKENNFPLEWAYKVGKEFDLSFDWLFEGKDVFREKEKRANELLNELELWLNEKAKNQPAIIDWFKYEMITKYPDFAEWKRKAEEEREVDIVQKQKIA